MLGYVTIGALDSEASGKFYDAVFGAMGEERKFADGGWIGYGPKGDDEPQRLCLPAIRQAARASRQRHHDRVQGEFESRGRRRVQGGAGAWRQRRRQARPAPGGFDELLRRLLRDPTGNKICVFCKP